MPPVVLTVTGSLALTVKVTIWPVLTLPLPLLMPAPVATIEATVGGVVSICSVPAGLKLEAPVKLAALPLPSVMVAPLRLRDETIRSAVF